MKITHHPQLESLMSCAAGSMPEPFAAVMASHIEMCSECRKELAVMEIIGTELFKSISPAELKRDPPVNALRRSESDPAPVSAPRHVMGDVPQAIVSQAARYLDDVTWSTLSPGVKHFPIALSHPGKGDLRLIKVAPGAALPEHGHTGSEMTLVLRGSYVDKTGAYHPGDVADLSDSVEHQPIADAKEGCICLIASDGKIRFKSILARLVQPFTGM